MQRTPAWFNARRGKLTASNFGTAAGVNPYNSRNKYLKEQSGTAPAFKGNEATQWGTRNEPNAIKDYQARTGNVVRAFGFKLHADYDWLGGSPDGLVGTLGMIEVKCPYYVQKPHAVIPPHYLCQINGLLEIFDREWCDYVSWTPTGMKVYRVYRDRALFDLLLSKYCTFYAAMSRGADGFPRQQRGERQETLDAISESDTRNDYTFWRLTEPAYQGGVWEAPFYNAFDNSDLSSDNASPVRKLRRLESPSPTGIRASTDDSAKGDLCPSTDVPEQSTDPERSGETGVGPTPRA